ncbi:MAG: SCO family protein [Candidatus Eremiobacteraeota bacterium]|nr:SCO family protein [Candidatus Eremiobacteraeota bacterium]
MSRAESLAVAVVFAAGLASTMFAARAGNGTPIAFDGTVRARHVPAVTLIDDRGAPLRLNAPAHGAIIVLGYTRCTDQCPLTLAKVAAALRPFDARTRPQAVLVTVDPAHDDPAKLHDFLGAWNNAITGATGEPATLAKLYLALGAGDGRSSPRDHDTRVFVIDRNGDVRNELAPNVSPTTIASAARSLTGSD